jgi:hypothetical protein
MGESVSEEHGDDGQSSAGSANGAILSVASPNEGQNCGVSPAFSLKGVGPAFSVKGVGATGGARGMRRMNDADETGSSQSLGRAGDEVRRQIAGESGAVFSLA